MAVRGLQGMTCRYEGKTVDPLSLMQAVWRYKVTSLVVLLLTALAMGGVLIWTPPVYKASASLLLVEPPDPPARSGSGDARTENPFVRYADTSVIINVVARRVQQLPARRQVEARGGVETYEVAMSRKFGPSPIIDISVTADSEIAALTTAGLVAVRTTRELAAVQEEEYVQPAYMFTARTIEQPEEAVRVVSGTLRKVVGVGALGLGALVLALALRRAWDERRPPQNPPHLVTGSSLEVLTPRAATNVDPPTPQARLRSGATGYAPAPKGGGGERSGEGGLVGGHAGAGGSRGPTRQERGRQRETVLRLPRAATCVFSCARQNRGGGRGVRLSSSCEWRGGGHAS